jgi:beta-barrel assembly-enhancing protease
MAFLAVFVSGPALGAQPPAATPLQALRALDVRVLTIGTRLAVANAPICRNQEWQSGILVHDLSLYGRGQQPAAAALFGLRGGPGVLALAAGGPGERAGLRLDDTIIEVDGQPPPRAPDGSANTYAATERIVEALEAAFADGRAELVVRRAEGMRRLRVDADRGCASRFQVMPSSRMEAKADGRYVQLTSAMVEFTRSDDELAAFVAHELAHNVLRHRARLNAAGVDRGPLASFGRNGRLFRQTELEADRLAVHLMSRAGFDPEAAVQLWTRQSRRDRRLFAGTHPAWSDRIAALRAEIAVISSARVRGEWPPPPIVDLSL